MANLKRKHADHNYDHDARRALYQAVKILPQGTKAEKRIKIAALKEFITDEGQVADEAFGLKRSAVLDSAKNLLLNLEHPKKKHVGFQINFFLTATEFRLPESTQRQSTSEIEAGLNDLSLTQ